MILDSIKQYTKVQISSFISVIVLILFLICFGIKLVYKNLKIEKIIPKNKIVTYVNEKFLEFGFTPEETDKTNVIRKLAKQYIEYEDYFLNSKESNTVIAEELEKNSKEFSNAFRTMIGVDQDLKIIGLTLEGDGYLKIKSKLIRN